MYLFSKSYNHQFKNLLNMLNVSLIMLKTVFKIKVHKKTVIFPCLVIFDLKITHLQLSFANPNGFKAELNFRANPIQLMKPL